MNRKILSLVIILLTLSPLYAENQKDKFDFDPSPVPETPLVSLIPSELKPETGLLISVTGMVGGTVLSYIYLQSMVDRSLKLDTAVNMQQDVMMSASCMLGSAVFAVFTDYFVKEIQKNKATLKE